MTDSRDSGRVAVGDRAMVDRLHGALATIYGVGQVLSRSLDLGETLKALLHVLERESGIHHSMISMSDPDADCAVVCAVQGLRGVLPQVRYRVGEGLTGTVLERGVTIALSRIADDARFLDRLGIFEPEKPFIAVPIKMGREIVGVIAVQPERAEGLDDYTQLIEMVANLICQSVRLSWEVAREKRALTEERDSLRRAVRREYGFEKIVGHSAGMQQVFEQVRQLVKWNEPVLLRGERGVGKGLIANVIHFNSSRSAAPFVKVNSAGIGRSLLESELFGHEKGAFSGAVDRRHGRFEQADGGTLFLDDIADAPLPVQARLLRILQTGEFERVGGEETLRVNVRLIVATHGDLERALAEGRFLESLYLHLNMAPIDIPPLRDRMEDVPEIARHLLMGIGREQGRSLALTEGAVRILLAQRWPGNVRELRNVLERAAAVSVSAVLDDEALRLCGLSETPASLRSQQTPGLDDPALSERERIMLALELAGWVQAKAARLLNMTPRQIAYRIQTLDIPIRHL